jgi:hypothetical protein
MFEIWWNNSAYLAEEIFENLEDAISFGRSKGFEFTIFRDHDMVGYAIGVTLEWYEA